MITNDQLAEIGKFYKIHGISGELAATFECDLEDVAEVSCIVVDIEGIFVPFFIGGLRPKGNASALLKLDGVDTEFSAKTFVGKTIYSLKEELEIEYDDDDARNYIGYCIVDDSEGEIGEIVGIDDSTENYLFIVEDKDGEELLIPIADEFITNIDDSKKVLEMQLPEGIIEL